MVLLHPQEQEMKLSLNKLKNYTIIEKINKNYHLIQMILTFLLLEA